jgi:uncharacterized protein YqfA (UPF0365 family)
MGQFLLGLALGAAAMLALVVWLLVNRSWRHAVFSGAPIPWRAILGMRLRGTPPRMIVDAYVILVKRGKTVDWRMVEAAYLAHGGARRDVAELVAVVERRPQARAT